MKGENEIMNKKWSMTALGLAALAFSVAASGFSIFQGVTPKETSAASSEGSYEITPTINPANGTGDSGTAFTTSTILNGTTYKANKVSYTYSLTGKENIASVSSTANTYPGRKSSWKVGKGGGDGSYGCGRDRYGQRGR